MQINKKITGLMVGLGALVGVGSSIAISVHAQTAPVQPLKVETTAPVQTTVKATATVAKGQDVKDTDNIQDPGGVEVPDTNTNESNDKETNDGKDEGTETHHFNLDPAHEAKEKAEANITTK